MKKAILLWIHFAFLFPLSICAQQGGVGINANGTSPHSSAGLDIDFDDRGLLIPRLTESERDAITNPAVGLMIYNTTSKCFNVYQVNEWHQLCASCIPPASPTGGSNTPLCEGETLNLTASSPVPGVSYHWTGPAGFESTLQNPVISNVNEGQAGQYSLTTTLNGCTTDPVSISVAITAPPVQPPAITGETCLEQAELSDNVYSIPNVAGVNYTWEITPSSGVTLTPTGNSCTISFPAGTASYTLSVSPSKNGCAGSSRTMGIETKVLCSIEYPNGNTAYWTEKDLGFRDVIISGGTTVYSFDHSNKQYRNGDAILIPDLTSTANGATVSATNFYGFSGGSANDINYQWDSNAIPVEDRGNNYSADWDRAPMFVSPAFTGVTYCRVLQDSYSGNCGSGDPAVTLFAPLAYPGYSPGAGSFNPWEGQEWINPGNIDNGTEEEQSSQQSIESDSYCVVHYGKGWRIPTHNEIGHRSDDFGNGQGFDIGYSTPSAASSYFFTSSMYNSGDPNGRFIYNEPGDYWTGGGVQGDAFYYRCVFSVDN